LAVAVATTTDEPCDILVQQLDLNRVRAGTVDGH